MDTSRNNDGYDRPEPRNGGVLVCGSCGNAAWARHHDDGVAENTTSFTQVMEPDMSCLSNNSMSPDNVLVDPTLAIFTPDTDQRLQTFALPSHAIDIACDERQSPFGSSMHQPPSPGIGIIHRQPGFNPSLTVYQTRPVLTTPLKGGDDISEWASSVDLGEPASPSRPRVSPAILDNIHVLGRTSSSSRLECPILDENNNLEYSNMDHPALGRPHVCPHDLCRSAFATKNDLDRHLATRKHRNDTSNWSDSANRFLCSVASCKRSKQGFSRKDHCVNHIKRMHPNLPGTEAEERS